MRNDIRCGFETVKARQIDRIGVDGVIKKLRERVGDSKVYVSTRTTMPSLEELTLHLEDLSRY